MSTKKQGASKSHRIKGKVFPVRSFLKYELPKSLQIVKIYEKVVIAASCEWGKVKTMYKHRRIGAIFKEVFSQNIFFNRTFFQF